MFTKTPVIIANKFSTIYYSNNFLSCQICGRNNFSTQSQNHYLNLYCVKAVHIQLCVFTQSLAILLVTCIFYSYIYILLVKCSTREKYKSPFLHTQSAAWPFSRPTGNFIVPPEMLSVIDKVGGPVSLDHVQS